jgi:hypothetical protein
MSRLLKIASEFNVAVVITNQARAPLDHASPPCIAPDARVRVLLRR